MTKTTYTPSREAKNLREAFEIAWEDGKRDGKAAADAKKAKRSAPEQVAREKKTYRVARLVTFLLGTGLFVATALFALSVGVWAWLVWSWAFVFWAKWQFKVAKNLKVKKAEWAAKLAD